MERPTKRTRSTSKPSRRAKKGSRRTWPWRTGSTRRSILEIDLRGWRGAGGCDPGPGRGRRPGGAGAVEISQYFTRGFVVATFSRFLAERLPLPSPEGTIPPVPTGNAGGEDPCIDKVLPASLQGEPVKIRIDNSTKATVSVSVYLQQTGPQSVCGYRSYTLAPGQFIVINDLVEGCYTLWAWNPDPDAYFIVTNGTSCIDTSNTWTFDISTRDIKPGS
jgi:hypothetical protein